MRKFYKILFLMVLFNVCGVLNVENIITSTVINEFASQKQVAPASKLISFIEYLKQHRKLIFSNIPKLRKAYQNNLILASV